MYAEETGMGSIATTLTQATSTVPVVGGVISAIGGLFGGNSKDPGRLASNAAAYGDAQAGDASAVTYLKARSGQYGIIPITPPWHGDPASPLGGWATDKAKKDALAKYQAVTQATPYMQTTTQGAGIPTTLIPAMQTAASVSPLLLLGGAALAYMLLKK